VHEVYYDLPTHLRFFAPSERCQDLEKGLS
jgi:hypothetical protein